MSSQENNQYTIYEDKKAIKFMDINSINAELKNRIYEKYYKLYINPYHESDSSFKSKKCPKCLKTRVGEYRIIYFINESKKEIEIIDIGLRKNIYKKWD